MLNARKGSTEAVFLWYIMPVTHGLREQRLCIHLSELLGVLTDTLLMQHCNYRLYQPYFSTLSLLFENREKSLFKLLKNFPGLISSNSRIQHSIVWDTDQGLFLLQSKTKIFYSVSNSHRQQLKREGGFNVWTLHHCALLLKRQTLWSLAFFDTAQRISIHEKKWNSSWRHMQSSVMYFKYISA